MGKKFEVKLWSNGGFLRRCEKKIKIKMARHDISGPIGTPKIPKFLLLIVKQE
jgi:hypothetical protein